MNAFSVSSASRTSMFAPQFAQVRELLASGVEEGVFPGAVLLVGKQGNVIFEESVGYKYSGEIEINAPMTIGTVFDVAAMTQPIVTASLVMLLIQQGKLKLNERVTRFVPGFGTHGKSEILIKNLLDHSSGLLHWHPFFEDLVNLNSASRLGILATSTAKDYVYQQISRLSAKGKPGAKQTFSDIGYILLGEVIERLTGYSLDKAAQRLLFHPLKMKSSSFIDLSLIKRGTLEAIPEMIAPTEQCSWRKRVICGEVHDDNAWAMGGVSGHSGLFISARDLHIFATHMLSSYFGEDSLVSQRIIRQFFYPWIDPESELSQLESELRQSYGLEGNRWRYGWEGPHEDNGMDKAGLSPFAIGSVGFTGCSMWLEPEAGVEIILLSNRVHPSRNNKKIKEYRPLLYSTIIEALAKVG